MFLWNGYPHHWCQINVKASLEQAFRYSFIPSLKLGMPILGAAASLAGGRAAKNSISSQRLETRFYKMDNLFLGNPLRNCLTQCLVDIAATILQNSIPK